MMTDINTTPLPKIDLLFILANTTPFVKGEFPDIFMAAE
jgi:hypothetical protein